MPWAARRRSCAGAEDLDPSMRYEQLGSPIAARLDAIHAERQRGHPPMAIPRRRCHAHHVGASTPWCSETARALSSEQAAARRALAEGLSVGSPCSVSRTRRRSGRLLPGEAVPALPAMPERRGASVTSAAASVTSAPADR